MTNKRIKAIPWYGGKYHLLKHILPLIPKHKHYIEVFAGGASVLFAKERSETEVLNDLNSGLVNLYRVLRDPKKFESFQVLVELYPYSREEYCHCKKTYGDCLDDVESAARFFVAATQCYSAILGSGWSRTTNQSARQMSAAVSKYLGRVDRLPMVHERLRGVQVENRDFGKIIQEYDSPDSFFYLDPPYVSGTRRSEKVYQHEMTDEDHMELTELLLGIKGKAMLSGYAHSIYGPLEWVGWRRYDYQAKCRTAVNVLSKNSPDREAMRKKMARTETIWLKDWST